MLQLRFIAWECPTRNVFASTETGLSVEITTLFHDIIKGIWGCKHEVVSIAAYLALKCLSTIGNIFNGSHVILVFLHQRIKNSNIMTTFLKIVDYRMSSLIDYESIETLYKKCSFSFYVVTVLANYYCLTNALITKFTYCLLQNYLHFHNWVHFKEKLRPRKVQGNIISRNFLKIILEQISN